MIFFNTLRLKQNRCHFAEDIFKCIFLNENVLISIKISLKFIPKGPINNIPTLVQIMAWRRPGNKPLSETMMIISLTHIWVAWPQWVKLLPNFPGANELIWQYGNVWTEVIGHAEQQKMGHQLLLHPREFMANKGDKLQPLHIAPEQNIV